MAGTGSPQSEPRAGIVTAEDRRAALARFLAAASGAESVEITVLAPLRGGAIQENWALDAYFLGGSFAGEQHLVLRTAAPTGVAASLGRLEEFAVLEAAFAAGVTVPEIVKPEPTVKFAVALALVIVTPWLTGVKLIPVLLGVMV